MFRDYDAQRHDVDQTIAKLKHSLSASSTTQHPAPEPESVLLKVGLQQEQAFRAHTSWELQFIQDQLSTTSDSIDIDELKTQTLVKMQKDLEIVQKMNKQLAEGRNQGIYNPANVNVFDGYNITFSLGSNKLETIFRGSITEGGKISTFESAPFIVKNYLEALLAGDLSDGYGFDYISDTTLLLGLVVAVFLYDCRQKCNISGLQEKGVRTLCAVLISVTCCLSYARFFDILEACCRFLHFK